MREVAGWLITIWRYSWILMALIYVLQSSRDEHWGWGVAIVLLGESAMLFSRALAYRRPLFSLYSQLTDRMEGVQFQPVFPADLRAHAPCLSDMLVGLRPMPRFVLMLFDMKNASLCGGAFAYPFPAGPTVIFFQGEMRDLDRLRGVRAFQLLHEIGHAAGYAKAGLFYSVVASPFLSVFGGLFMAFHGVPSDIIVVYAASALAAWWLIVRLSDGRLNRELAADAFAATTISIEDAITVGRTLGRYERLLEDPMLNTAENAKRRLALLDLLAVRGKGGSLAKTCWYLQIKHFLPLTVCVLIIPLILLNLFGVIVAATSLEGFTWWKIGGFAALLNVCMLTVMGKQIEHSTIAGCILHIDLTGFVGANPALRERDISEKNG